MDHLRELLPDHRGRPRPGAGGNFGVVAPPVTITGEAFDVTTIGYFVDAQPVSGVSFWPLLPIVEVPSEGAVAQITHVAVQAAPRFFFLSGCFWSLVVGIGPFQEWRPDTRQNATDTALPIQQPEVVSGVRYTAFGSLDNPQPLRVQLEPDSVLQLQVGQEGVGHTGTTARPLTVHCRVRGVVQQRK